MTVIEKAEHEYNVCREREAEEYWKAYLDGAKAQLKEDLKALLDYEKLKKQTQIASDINVLKNDTSGVQDNPQLTKTVPVGESGWKKLE